VRLPLSGAPFWCLHQKISRGESGDWCANPCAARGQTDLEVFVEKLLNRSDPEATRGYRKFLRKFLWKNF
jgi:hypothetical protein